MCGFGVGKVVDSGHPDFKIGEFVCGETRWEEYSLITTPEKLFKIKYTDVPLSYYTGILGEELIYFIVACYGSPFFLSISVSSFLLVCRNARSYSLYWIL